MNTLVPYKIVVPSRRRAPLMLKLFTLLPDATICVEESEEAEYAEVVPPSQLVLHPPVSGMGEKRNWMLDHFSEQALCMIDDDLQMLISHVHTRPKRYRDANVIRQVIENGVNIATDLGLSLYHWSRFGNPISYSNCEPFGLANSISSAFIVLGRDYRFDDNLASKADVDMSLQHMLKERIVITDRRWHFKFRKMFTLGGGDQGRRTAERMKADEDYLQRKWRGHLNLNARKGRKMAANAQLRIVVCRKNPAGYRGAGPIKY